MADNVNAAPRVTSATYVRKVTRTESCDMALIGHRLRDTETIRLLHAAMGMATEAGELLDAMKKAIFYDNRTLDRVNVVEELGDLLWYVAVACDVLGVSLDEVMTRNIAKLRQRYPDRFTSEAAITRDLIAERAVLEGGK